MKTRTVIISAIVILLAFLVLPVSAKFIPRNYSLAELDTIQDEISIEEYPGIVSTWIDEVQQILHVDLDSRMPESYFSAVKLFLTYGSAVTITVAPITATTT